MVRDGSLTYPVPGMLSLWTLGGRGAFIVPRTGSKMGQEPLVQVTFVRTVSRPIGQLM
jgi:hypothetical protein